MQTPNTVSIHLLKALMEASQALPVELDNEPIDAGVLLLGIAEMLGDLLSEVPPAVQKELLPLVLDRIVSHVRGGTLVVMRVGQERPTEH